MIKKSEINSISTALGIRTSTIDKDWVLGHFIDSIFSIQEFANSLIFKGETCLKKCRFSDYRFSEDLDFTSTNSVLSNCSSPIMIKFSKQPGIIAWNIRFRRINLLIMKR